MKGIEMDYLLSVYHEERNMADVDPADMERAFKAVDAFNQEVQDAGAWVYAGGLYPPSAATTIRHQAGGGLLTTDGPFAETKEQIGGFWIIRAADLDEAMKWAEKGAIACGEHVEVRPFQELPEE